MYNKLLKIFLIVSLIFTVKHYVHAQGSFDPQDFSYILHLYYSNGKLTLNKDFKVPYDLLGTPFEQVTIGRTNAFRGIITNMQDRVVSTFNFDPTSGNPGFKEGRVDIISPYEPSAKEIAFYNSQNSRLLGLDLSEVNVCNNDGSCDVENGETYQVCPSDCRAPTPISAISPSPSTQPETGRSFVFVYFVAGFLLVALFIWVIIRKLRR